MTQTDSRFRGFLILISLVLMSAREQCSAAPVRILEAPASVIAGDTFRFNVLLPATTNLAAYQIEVLLGSTNGSVGVDYQFLSAEAMSPGDGYVFPSNSAFFSTALNDSTTTQRMVLTDFELTGGNTIVGVNDRIASVSVETMPGYAGVLELRIEANALILDGPEINPTPVPEYNSIVAHTLSQAPVLVNVTAIPEPAAGTLLVGVFAWVLVLQRRRRRSVAPKQFA